MAEWVGLGYTLCEGGRSALGRASRKRRDKAEARASGTLVKQPREERPTRPGMLARGYAADDPNRRLFLFYATALLGLWTVGVSMFPQSPLDQVAAMGAAWLLTTAAAIVYRSRFRKDGVGWVGPFLRRVGPLALGVAAFWAIVWFGAPQLVSAKTLTYVHGLIPGLLVAVLMVGTGRMLFPTAAPRASR
jgi:hypothetical protein